MEVEKARLRKRCKKSLFSSLGCSVPDKDYGPAALRPDVEEDVFASESHEFLQNLKKSED